MSPTQQVIMLCTLMLGLAPHALAEKRVITDEVVQKILTAGVPEAALQHVLDFRDKNLDRVFQEDVYTCPLKPTDNPNSVKPCEEEKRTKAQKGVSLVDSKYMVIIDYTLSSMEQRLFFINNETGEVQRYRVAHGKGTGELYAYRFSNIKDSKESSLGMYVTGDTYVGDHGVTLRLYGLDKSNDQAYIRDIVFHGAWYSEDSFPKSINPATNLPYGRLGQSWGCPAVDTNVALKLIPLLKGGALLYHYFPALEEAAMSGQEVSVHNPEMPVLPDVGPVPLPRPTGPDTSTPEAGAEGT